MQSCTRLGWGLLLGLLSSCQSQQAVFLFQPAPPVAAQAVFPPRSTPETVTEEGDTPPQRHRPQPIQLAQRLVAVARAEAGPQQDPRPARQPRHLMVQRRQPATAVAARPTQTTRHDALHIVLGALLIAGGVVGGIALGGWLGLGVGALVVLLGYYFVVLGIGGKHAWLEIFQEFFNM